MIGWSGSTGYYDWVGIFPEGSGNYSYVSYFYTYGQSGGYKTVTAPASPGRYVISFLPNNGELVWSRLEGFRVSQNILESNMML